MKKIALLTAAGKGERFGGLMAKELYPLGSEDVNGKHLPKPISRYMFDALRRIEPDIFYFVVHPTKPQLVYYYGNGRRFDTKVAYLVQEEPTSQYSAIEEIRYFMEKDDIVFYAMPDTVVEPGDIFITLHKKCRKEKADITIGMFKVKHPQFFTTVELDKNGNFLRAEIKPKQPKTNWIWGVLVFNYRFFEIADEIRNTTQGVVGSDDIGAILNGAKEKGAKISCHRFNRYRYYDFASYDKVLNYIRDDHSA